MDLRKLGEFGLIEDIKQGIEVPQGYLGIGDDCAVMPQKSGMETLVSTDMLIEGTHFLMDDISAYRLGWKSAAVNISDIAAMGGRCTGSFLSFALPKGLGKEWTDEFFRGYKEISSLYGCPLLGGDTTSSPDRLCISVTVTGEAPAGKSVKRSYAAIGDLICVTGNLGDSGCGLKIILEGSGRDADAEILIARHYLPMPRVKEGMEIAAAGASAMMDISDGIGSDLRHIIEASGVGAEIDTSMIPLSNELKSKCAEYGWDPLELAISGGEDYELLFTISEENAKKIDFNHFVIGKIISGDKIIWRGSERDYMGFRHF
ncbi:MAG: thiamine-phosphate kinase [Bacteroidales bacterium]|nr:thiamine-phosphate kinase [Bacteroidales bacterium]